MNFKSSVKLGNKNKLKKKNARLEIQSGIRKAAAAYSPTWCSSTIGACELNFSVRDGKRWFLTAITAAVFYLREIIQSVFEKDFGRLVQVS